METTDDPRVRALETNHDSFMDLVSRIAPMVRDPDDDVVSFFSGIPFPMLNGISAASFAPGQEERRTHELVDRSDAREMPYLWTLTPSSTTVEIERTLEARGLQREDDPGMYVAASTVAPTRLPAGVEVHGRPADDVAAHVELMIEAFEMPRWLGQALGTAFSGVPADRAHTVVGTLDGEPVGIGMLLDIGGAAGLYNIATLRSARGRGVGYAVTNALVDLARDLGREDVVLIATPQGYPVYERLGFRTVCTVTHFLGNLPSDPSS